MGMFRNKTSRALLITMCVVVLAGIAISYVYYNNLKKSADPRIVNARALYEKYNAYAQKNDFDSIFWLMDSIEFIYNSIDHYKQSYEVGVLYNNRAASFLTLALYSKNIETSEQDSLVELAERSANKSVEIYQSWLDRFQNKSDAQIENLVLKDFYYGLDAYPHSQKNMYFKNRVKEIQDSQSETKRRLSVSYTNLGVISRHKLNYESAAHAYKKAIDLWDRNLTAENNLNILLGQPLKERNFIQKMFPPEKD